MTTTDVMPIYFAVLLSSAFMLIQGVNVFVEPFEHRELCEDFYLYAQHNKRIFWNFYPVRCRVHHNECHTVQHRPSNHHEYVSRTGH